MASGAEDSEAINDKKYPSELLPGVKPHPQDLAWRRLFLRKGKLRASSRTSALMSGFAMVAMVEIKIDEDLPPGLIIAFSVLTTILISIHVFALMISVCILPNLDSMTNMYSLHPHNIDSSAHEQMHNYIEVAWIFSTGLGTLLFLAEVAVISWVQFYKLSKEAAIASSCILVPVGIIFIWFALHFYNTLVKYKYERQSQGLEELELFAEKLQPSDIHQV